MDGKASGLLLLLPIFPYFDAIRILDLGMVEMFDVVLPIEQIVQLCKSLLPRYKGTDIQVTDIPEMITIEFPLRMISVLQRPFYLGFLR